MDESIGRLVANIGVERTAAETAVGITETAIGITFDFLSKEAAADKMQMLSAKLPGAEALMQKAASEGGGVTGAGTRMMGARLSMGEVRGIVREFIGFARERIGENELGKIVAAVPGLAQFV